MDTKKLITSLIFLQITLLSWTQVLESSCEIRDSDVDSLMETAYSIALEEMFWSSHYFHDSIYVPEEFVDSIFRGFIAYENAYNISESLVHLSDFQYFKSSTPFLVLFLNDSLNCFDWKENGNGEDQLIILDALANQFIDSLNLSIYYSFKNEVDLIDNNNRINLAGNFGFIEEYPCIDSILHLNSTGDPGWEDTIWTGEFSDEELYLSFQYTDTTDGNYVFNKWLYSVNSNCEVIIHRIPQYTDKNTLPKKYTYPNPFSDKIVFDTDQDIMDIKIYSLDGIIVKEIDSAGMEIQTGDLSPGAYILSFRIGTKVFNNRIIKL